MKTLKFYKEDDQWYFDKPWIEHLVGKYSMAMVSGADDLLDIISEDKDEVTLEVSTSNFKGSEMLVNTGILPGIFNGSFYKLLTLNGKSVNHDLWLCGVTLLVFFRYPKYIYFKKV